MKIKIIIFCLFFIIGFTKIGKSHNTVAPYNILISLSPKDSQVIKTQYPVFTWKDSTNNGGILKKYKLWINNNLADSVFVPQTSVTLNTPLADGKYTWFVSVYDTSGNQIANSKTITFFIDTHPPAKFMLISPVNGDTSTDCILEFVWHQSSFSTGLLAKYQFNISGLPSVTVAPTDTVLDYPYYLPNGTYSWFVTVYDLAGKTTNSDTLSFTKNGNVNTIWGYLEYDNIFNTRLNNVKLTLVDYSNNVIATTTTNNAGYYAFDNIGNGSYSIKGVIDIPAGGINPTDALEINRYYIKLYHFADDLKKAAADVNADGKINPLDAILVNRFYIKLISGLPAGKWLFSNNTFIINCDLTLQVNLRAICVGDVDGSFKP